METFEQFMIMNFNFQIFISIGTTLILNYRV
nr:MAG TPA: hypothetical protein [Caudoviricetes sp.]